MGGLDLEPSERGFLAELVASQLMQPWETLEKARTPDGSELTLARRGQDYSIRIDNRELMTSRTHGSEEQLAQAACAPIRRRQAPRVLIGGLGMGYTLRAALETLGPEASVVVAELTPQVLEWNRTHLAELAGRPLDDSRARVELVDVGNLLDGKTKWDAVKAVGSRSPRQNVPEGRGGKGLICLERGSCREESCSTR